MKPTIAEIERFLLCWDTLGQFEAQHQLMRGWGAFAAAEWPDKPDPAVVKVVEWLKEAAYD